MARRAPPSDAPCAAGDPAAFAALLGHAFNDPDLLARALRHPSATPRPLENNQRLEFLGDRVLGLVVAEMLHETFPTENEGALARRFAALVSRPALAQVAVAIGLGSRLELGPSEAESDGRDNPANLADALEAVIAAIYIDGGMVPAAAFIRAHWAPMAAEVSEPPRDAKTRLQEWSQGRGGQLPEYLTVAESGPPHAPVFEVEVRLPGVPPARATGSSKRAAEQAAAERMLAGLEAARS